LISSSNSTVATPIMTGLEKSIADLNHLVENKVPAQELMTVVHGQVHPNLQLAYNLKLRQ
jgi:hypothetical protein